MGKAPLEGGGSSGGSNKGRKKRSNVNTSDANFEAFFNAIAGQESGGDYGAVNRRTGASGKFQIMPANIGPWSRQYLGRTITVSQFRNSPELQEELARAVLGSYWRKYGARGAASAWYSGRPNKESDYHRFRRGEPSIGEYVDSVMNRMVRRSGNGKTNPAPAGTYSPPVVAGRADPKAAGQPVPTRTIDNRPFGTKGAPPSPVPDPFAWDGAGDPFGTNPGGSTSGDPFAPTAQGAQGTQGKAMPTPNGQIDANVAAGPRPGESSSSFRDRIISEAMRYIGVPYVWGGTSPKGFDCSGIIKYVYGKMGYDLPRISAAQARSGRRTDVSKLRAGDLVATDNSSRNSGADHIAIYAGGGYIIEAPHAGADVRRRKLGKSENYWGVALDLPGD